MRQSRRHEPATHLNRPLTVRTPDDEAGAGYVTTTTQYGSRAVTGGESGAIGAVGYVTNPKNIRTKSTNSQGKVVAIIQNDTASAGNVSRTITTKTYDALGQLKETNAEGAIITNVYDVRGRRIGTTDPDMGIWTYEYNAFGELKLQTDAKAQVTENFYDNLGRPTMRKVYVASSTTVEGRDKMTCSRQVGATRAARRLHDILFSPTRQKRVSSERDEVVVTCSSTTTTRHLPRWRHHRRELNSAPLAHESWARTVKSRT